MNAAKKPARNPVGRPRLAFTDDARTLVRVLAGWGMPHAAIASQIRNPSTGKPGISKVTLYEHFRDELDNGATHLIATAMVTQNKLMMGGKDNVRERVSYRILRRFGYLGDDGFVVRHQNEPAQPEADTLPGEAREVDAIELEKAILSFIHDRTEFEPPTQDVDR